MTEPVKISRLNQASICTHERRGENLTACYNRAAGSDGRPLLAGEPFPQPSRVLPVRRHPLLLPDGAPPRALSKRACCMVRVMRRLSSAAIRSTIRGAMARLRPKVFSIMSIAACPRGAASGSSFGPPPKRVTKPEFDRWNLVSRANYLRWSARAGQFFSFSYIGKYDCVAGYHFSWRSSVP